jgi:serine phosphatase RsbU (regulator of sigma subunit)
VSRALVVAEIALAFTLLASSAVLVVHLRNLTRVSPGFNADDLLTFALTPSQVPENDASRFQQEARFVSALEGIPGVTSAAYTNQLPLDGCCLSTTIYPDGSDANPTRVQRISFLAVSPGYFRTVQLPLHSGRYLDERDVKAEPILVVINEAAARFYWPGRNPVDVYGRFGGSTGERFQVVGIVGDVRNDGLGKPTVPEIYLSSARFAVNPMLFLVRSALPSATLVPEIRRAIQSVDASQPIHNVTTISEIVHDSVSLERVGSFMISCFAVAALLMAALGVYGVVSYAVRQGTVEFGTRMALGAVGRDLLVLVVGGGLRMAAYGAAIGAIAIVAAAWALVRLFEIRDLGVLPFMSSTGIVAGVATVASFVPAWRVTRLSPMVAIRNEPSWEWESARRSIRETLGRVVRAVSQSDDVPRATTEDLVTELVAAARGATSFAEAFHQALATLCHRLGATSAMLLEHKSGEYRPIASIPADAQAVTLPADGFLVNRLQYYGYPLPFSAADIDSWRQWARDNDLGHETELDALSASGARIAVGLRARTDILGVLLLGAPSGGAKYSSADKRLLRQCSDELTLMIENARLTTRVVEQEKLRRDVALAAEVQRRLLPERPPARRTVSLEAISLPARTVGGDYYDFLELSDQKIGIALADVAGKGVAAALLMAVVQASLRSVTAESGPSVSQLASRLNDLLQRATASNSYATFFYAQFDERSRRLDYVNAGHNPPYLVRAPAPQATAEIVALSVGGTVLGLFPQMSYEEAAVALRPGDVLVAYTDGVTEALNAAEEEFGEDRLKALLRDLVHRSAPEISSGISTALRTWIKDTPQHDDLTFVVMKVH